MILLYSGLLITSFSFMAGSMTPTDEDTNCFWVIDDQMKCSRKLGRITLFEIFIMILLYLPYSLGQSVSKFLLYKIFFTVY